MVVRLVIALVLSRAYVPHSASIPLPGSDTIETVKHSGVTTGAALQPGDTRLARPPQGSPADDPTAASAARPNVLILLVDDLGYSDIASFGSPNVSTPHMDALVRSGVKMTSWISAGSTCTPSRSAIQTGRQPVRTGMVWTPVCISHPNGLDPGHQISIARALKGVGYATGMSGKWGLGINSDGQDRHFTPNAHGYDSYLGNPFSSNPSCEEDESGYAVNTQASCLVFGNDTVVEMPQYVEDETDALTRHAVDFVRTRGRAGRAWFFFMSYMHVHVPLFSAERNRGRSVGGVFGDNVEEVDDSVGTIMSAIADGGMGARTITFFLSDNGPLAEEGWDMGGRVNLYAEDGSYVGRLRGSKGQVTEGGVRVPAAVHWPGVTSAGSVSNTLVSSLDLFPTILRAAGAMHVLPRGYSVDGKDMREVLAHPMTARTRHEVLLLYCDFNPIAARVFDRYKVFWALQNWYTSGPPDPGICTQCCLAPSADATTTCSCNDDALTYFNQSAPIVFDLHADVTESTPLNASSWPPDADVAYADVVHAANAERQRFTDRSADHSYPQQDFGLLISACIGSEDRQPCCPGCHAVAETNSVGFPFVCVHDDDGSECRCGPILGTDLWRSTAGSSGKSGAA